MLSKDHVITRASSGLDLLMKSEVFLVDVEPLQDQNVDRFLLV